MPKTVTLTDLNNTLDATIRQCESSIEKFKKNLDENPEYAFRWGTDALAASATLRVVQEAKHYANMENEVDGEPVAWENRLANMVEYFERSAMSAAEQVPASTSVLSNLSENYTRQALVKLVNTLKGSHFRGF